MRKQTQQNKSPAKTTANGALKAARRNVQKQAALAVFTIAVTVVLLFAMTTAWYTNVIETGGLTFEAEAWGFEGDVIINEGTVQAAPGDTGIVELSITNESDNVSAVTVSVSKEVMLVGPSKQDRAMQKRLYFYIDEQKVINGEPVNKQYLTNTNGHTYTLFSQNSLILSEDLHTDSLLKWEWVFDLVGYYFRGTVDAESRTMMVEEYLRPVEYDPYEATYAKNTGYLLTTDGTTTINSFITAITREDGYLGTYADTDNDGILEDWNDRDIVPVQLDTGLVYPVYSDSDQQIWLYFCNKTEIEQNTLWDTAFGASETPEQFHARIDVTGQQIQQNAVMISNPTELNTALNDAEGGIVRLESNMIMGYDSRVTLTKDASAVLDLNGYSLTYSGDATPFTVQDGGSLTVINGTLKGDTEKETTAFYTMGGQVTVSNLIVDDVYMAFNIEDHKTSKAQGANSSIRIVDCDISTEYVSVKVNGDGSLSGEKTNLVIQDSKIRSETYIGVCGNGNATNPGNWGTDIQIINSEIYGHYAGIYHPQQQSTMTISDSEISGITGMAVKGGDILIMNSAIRGVGTDDQVVEPATYLLTGNGFLDTGDGIYVESDYEQPITIQVFGDNSVVSSVATTAKAVRVFPAVNYVQITISGGLYDEDVSQFMATGYACAADSNGNYIVTKVQQ